MMTGMRALVLFNLGVRGCGVGCRVYGLLGQSIHVTRLRYVDARHLAQATKVKGLERTQQSLNNPKPDSHCAFQSRNPFFLCYIKSFFSPPV